MRDNGSKHSPFREKSEDRKLSFFPFELSRKWKGALLFALAFVFYLTAIPNEYVWDDEGVIVNNFSLRNPRGLRAIWFEPQAMTSHESHYWPITYTTFWLEYQLWGDIPYGYHFNNVLLHCLNALLLWLLLVRMKIPGAWFAAALFGVHPVHVESVAWVTERKDLLSLLFTILAFRAYIRFSEHPGMRRYLSVLGLFLCSMMSKTVSVTFPAVLVIWHWWRNGAIKKKDILPLFGLFALAFIYALGDMWLNSLSDTSDHGFSWLERGLLAGHSLWLYASKVLWPVGLHSFYPKWAPNPHAMTSYLYIFSFLILIGAIWFRKSRGTLAAVLMYAIMLTPTLGFIDFEFMAIAHVADRFQYMASAALIVLFAAGFHRFLHRYRRVRFIAASVLILSLGILTLRLSWTYHSLETFGRYSVSRNPKHWVPRGLLGLALGRRGDIDQGIVQLERSVQMNPRDALVLNNLAVFLANGDRFEEAEDRLKEALTVEDNYPPTYNNLANIYLLQERYTEAEEALKRSIELEPNDSLTLNNLAFILSYQEKHDEAKKYLNMCIERFPEYPNSYTNLGRIFAAQGRPSEAVLHYKEALAIAPDQPDVRKALAQAYMDLGENEKALQALTEEIDRDPFDPLSHKMRGDLLIKMGRGDEGKAHLKEFERLGGHAKEGQRQTWSLPDTNALESAN